MEHVAVARFPVLMNGADEVDIWQAVYMQPRSDRMKVATGYGVTPLTAITDLFRVTDAQGDWRRSKSTAGL